MLPVKKCKTFGNCNKDSDRCKRCAELLPQRYLNCKNRSKKG